MWWCTECETENEDLNRICKLCGRKNQNLKPGLFFLLPYFALFIFSYSFFLCFSTDAGEARVLQRLFGLPWADFLYQKIEFRTYPTGLFFLPILLNGFILYWIGEWIFTRITSRTIKSGGLLFIGIILPFVILFSAELVLEGSHIPRATIRDHSILVLIFGLLIELFSAFMLRNRFNVFVIFVFLICITFPLLLVWVVSYPFVFGFPGW